MAVVFSAKEEKLLKTAQNYTSRPGIALLCCLVSGLGSLILIIGSLMNLGSNESYYNLGVGLILLSVFGFQYYFQKFQSDTYSLIRKLKSSLRD